MEHITEQKCKACGGPLRFDPESGLLVCDHCGTTQDISADLKAEEITLEGFDFDALAQQASDAAAAALPIYHCVSCRAEVIAPAEQFALTCPYCGNNIVLTDKVTGALRPDGVVPFRIDKKHLPDAMKQFYKGKVLLPKNFFSESVMSKVTGVYLPFWMFSGRLTGALQFLAEDSSTHRDGNYVVTETRHYQVVRNADLSFTDVPVDASGRVEDRLMDSLEPFDLTDEVPFDMGYLAGFTADRFDQTRGDVEDRARSRMLSSAEYAVSNTLRGEYDNFSRTGGQLRASLRARYLLLPVYLFSIRHGGEDYSFAVNGQTGKVVGDLPISRSVSTRYFLLRFGAVAAGIAAFFFARYMLGG